MKKLLALLFCSFLFVGCSASTNEESDNTENTTSDQTTEETTEEVATEGTYVVTNTTGEVVNELYVYQTGSEDKGQNYAEGGLADGESVTIEVSVDEAEAEGYAQTLEYATESGRVESGFQTLALEEANMNLLAADAETYTSATPFEWGF